MPQQRGGNRRLNRAVQYAALTQATWEPRAIAYLARKQAEGKTKREALRCLKRRLSNVIFRPCSPTPTLPTWPLDHRSSTASSSGSTRRSKYEDLYRHDIGDGLVLAERIAGYLTVYNTIRPHEAIGFDVPLARYLQAASTPPGANLQAPETVSDS